MLILQCIIGFQSQSIDFTNAFAQAYITSGKPFFIELPRYFNSDGGKYDVVIRLKKILYVGPALSTRGNLARARARGAGSPQTVEH